MTPISQFTVKGVLALYTVVYPAYHRPRLLFGVEWLDYGVKVSVLHPVVCFLNLLLLVLFEDKGWCAC